MRIKLFYVLFLQLLLASLSAPAQSKDALTGLWIASDKNVEVEIVRGASGTYSANLVWFDDSDDPSRPMLSRNDRENPDSKLRSRKLIGMKVMTGLEYDAASSEWQHGKIYDSSTGKTWSAKAWLVNDQTLKVRGYWHFEWIGQNLTFFKK